MTGLCYLLTTNTTNQSDWRSKMAEQPRYTSSLCYFNTHHIAHCTLHIYFCTPALPCISHFTFYFTFLYKCFIYLDPIYCVLSEVLLLCVAISVFLCFMLCVVLIVFVCFVFTVCTYTPEQIPGRCKPTWQ